MTRTLCKPCAEEYGKRFDLRALLKGEIKKCSCEICGKRASCMIYEVKRLDR